MKNLLRLVRIAPLALLFAGVASAQNNGVVIGVVTDGATGKPVVGAVVIATSPAAQGEQTAVTDNGGNFRIENLAPGTYTLSVQMEGYRPAERGDLVVRADTTLRANLAVAPEAVQMEEIVVTGSRIRRKDLTTPAPVTVISTEQLAASGRVSIGEFLQSLPEQGNATNTQVNNGGAGNTQIDLRGLGALRTLVLVNGRRMVFTGTGANTGTGVDLNTIPTAAIERIEVLKDGASAVYGSDAVSGVVNIITKKNFTQTSVNGFAGISQEGDAGTYDVNVSTGTAGERGSVLFAAGYYEQRPSMAGDRDFSRYQLDLDYTTGTVTRIGSSRAPSGRITIAGSSGAGNALWDQLVAANPTAGSFTWDPTLTNPTTGQATGWYRPFVATEIAPAGDLYNFQPENYNVTPNRRISLYATGDTRFGDVARGYFEASYVTRNSSQQLAPEPLIFGAGGVPVTISAQSIYNPFNKDFVTYSKRLNEFGPRRSSQDLDTFRLVGGVDGTLGDVAGPLQGWFWDVSLNYGRTTGTDVNRGNLVPSAIQQAVGPSFIDPETGTPTCGTPAAPIANCVPLDLFHGAGAITQDQTTNLTFTGVSRVFNELTAIQANVAGELFPLLGDRPMGLALGYEFRTESGADIPDPRTASGDATGNIRSETSGDFNVNEGYAELSIPILSAMPFAEDLEATAAARVFNYSTFGSDWTYKLGGRWRIVPDFTVRGTFSTAFRAPSINELYLGTADNFPDVSDPCADLAGADPALIANCTADGVAPAGSGDDATQLRSLNGGNPDLQPETADIWTVGVVLEPRWLPNFSATVDYYNIQVEDAIQTVGASLILSQCYNEGKQQFCDLIERDPATTFVTRIDDRNVNVGGDETDGIDVSLRYRLNSAFGAFGFAVDANWLRKFNRIQADGTTVEGRGNFDIGLLDGGTGGVFPRFKGNAGVIWGLGGLGAGVSTRYVHSFRECAFDSAGDSSGGLCHDDPGFDREVSAYNAWDAFVSYDLKNPIGSTLIAAGVRNVFDTQPPRIYSAFTPTSDPTAYDFVGRFFYVNVGHRF